MDEMIPMDRYTADSWQQYPACDQAADYVITAFIHPVPAMQGSNMYSARRCATCHHTGRILFDERFGSRKRASSFIGLECGHDRLERYGFALPKAHIRQTHLRRRQLLVSRADSGFTLNHDTFPIYKRMTEPRLDDVSDATKAKMSASHLGKKQSEETKAKIAAKAAGRSHSELTKEKCRQARLGIKSSEETREKIRQVARNRVRDKATGAFASSNVVDESQVNSTNQLALGYQEETCESEQFLEHVSKVITHNTQLASSSSSDSDSLDHLFGVERCENPVAHPLTSEVHSARSGAAESEPSVIRIAHAKTSEDNVSHVVAAAFATSTTVPTVPTVASHPVKASESDITSEGGSESEPKEIVSSRKGRKVSEETKRKISESMKGRQKSQEHRLKISAAVSGEKNPRYGKEVSNETRLKISAANRGRILTDEIRRKISLSHLRKAEESNKRRKRFISVDAVNAPLLTGQDGDKQGHQNDLSARDMAKLFQSGVEQNEETGNVALERARRAAHERFMDQVRQKVTLPQSVVRAELETKRSLMENSKKSDAKALVCKKCGGKGICECERCLVKYGASNSNCDTCFGSGYVFCSVCDGMGTVKR